MTFDRTRTTMSDLTAEALAELDKEIDDVIHKIREAEFSITFLTDTLRKLSKARLNLRPPSVLGCNLKEPS